MQQTKQYVRTIMRLQISDLLKEGYFKGKIQTSACTCSLLGLPNYFNLLLRTSARPPQAHCLEAFLLTAVIKTHCVTKPTLAAQNSLTALHQDISTSDVSLTQCFFVFHTILCKLCYFSYMMVCSLRKT